MNGMIFAAGLGTRLRPLTDTMPKALVPLNGKTLLEHQVERLKNAGISNVVVNVHHFADVIVRFAEEHDNWGMNIAFSDEREQLLDTGGGLRKASCFLDNGEETLACNVDILSNICIEDLMKAHRKEDLATLVVSERTTQRYLLFDEANRLKGWTNIATGARRPDSLGEQEASQLRRLAFSGMQIVSPRIFEQTEGLGDKFSLIDLYLNLCTKQNLRAYVPINYKMMDVGKIDHLAEAEEFAKTIDN